MAKGIPMKVHKVDSQGGYIQGAGGVFPMPALTAANPGAASIVLPKGTKIATTGSPFSVTIAGVTGSGDEASINGARTFTRTGDNTGTIGVNTTTLIYDSVAATITGIPLETDDANVPNRTVYDWDE